MHDQMVIYPHISYFESFLQFFPFLYHKFLNPIIFYKKIINKFDFILINKVFPEIILFFLLLVIKDSCMKVL